MIIYDCEIISAIPPRGDEERLPDIVYCKGWRDFEGMGISCIGAYDYVEDRYRVFTVDNFGEFQELVNRAAYVIGFNSLQFDNPLCRANGIDIPEDRSWDILAELWAAAGLSCTWGGKTHLGFGLDACAAANFGEAKSGHGALAPVQWQRGQIGAVIDYCLQDVRLTKRLMDRISRDGYLVDPRDTSQVLRFKHRPVVFRDLAEERAS